MKKIFKNINLLLILCALIAPTTFVNAEDPDNTGSIAPTSENTEPTVKEESLSNDATLDELRVEGIDLDSKFSPDDLEYTATVKSDVSSVNIIAKLPDGSKAKLDSSQLGIKNLNVGKNTFSIKVVAEDGKSELVYKIVVNRATSDLNLTKLNIQGQKLNEAFDSETYEYTVDVSNDVTSITVQTGKPTGTKVSVVGNSNLKVGKNTVTVTVKNDAGESKEYKIIVTRSIEEDSDKDSDDNTSTESVSSVLTSDNVTSDNLVVDTSEDLDDDNENNNNSLRSIIIVTSSILLLLIAGLGIYFYVRSGDSEKRRNKKIEKLKKKQAKIEQQLTGLMPIITEEQENEYLSRNVEVEKEEIQDNDKDEVEYEEIEEQDDEDDTSVEYYEEEFEATIEIEPETINKTRRTRMDKTIFDEDFDDLFDDRD